MTEKEAWRPIFLNLRHSLEGQVSDVNLLGHMGHVEAGFWVDVARELEDAS